MSEIKVRLGFVPSYRFSCTPWCKKMREDSLTAFSEVKGMEVIVPQPSSDGKTLDPENGYTPNGTVSNLDQAEVVAEYFQRQKVDGLILCPLDFGDERSAAKIAEKLKVPVLLYATKEPPAFDDSGLSRASDSYCGNLSMASGLYRRKIPFHYAGIFFPDEHEFKNEVQEFVRAVAVVKGFKGARFGQVGVRPSSFETVGYDETAMIRSFGQNVIHIELGDIVANAESYSDDDPQIQAIVSDIKNSYAKITVSDNYLIKSAKMEFALTQFWNRNKLSGMAMQCWSSIQRSMGISVCALYGRLTQKGMLTACETDILGALSMLANYQAGLGETLPHFIDWTIQHREDSNWLLAWHCGNAPVCLAKDPDKTALRSRRDMKGELSIEDNASEGLAQFQIKSGIVTMCRLAEYDDEWKMLITTGEIIPSDEELAGTWAWVEVKDHKKLYRILVEEGFIHHASMIHGDQTKALLQACKFLNIKPIVVD